MQVEKDAPVSLEERVLWSPFSDWLRSVHCVGIAGTGLRGLATLFHERGVKVTGSEQLDSPVLEKFSRRGILCRVGHSGKNVEQDTSLVLISAAVKETNPEVQAAKLRSIPVLKYSQCLGRLMSEKVGIAVAGTHGKTTTTTMVSLILQKAGLDPSFVIGGEYPEFGGNARWGNGPYFVAEACEYDRSFLNLHPNISVVTNIEEDHLDYFESLKEIQGAFADFVSLLPEDGYLVVNRDDPNSNYLSEFCRSPVGTFSTRPKGGDWWAEDLVHGESGYEFRIVNKSGEETRVKLRVPGLHNVSDALAATAVCRQAGVPLAAIGEILGTFKGVRRRFDILHRGDIVVVDDYAHHPTEIQMVLRAARHAYPGRRLVAVFQPHQHSRLKKFKAGFAKVLSCFDMALITDVFTARDTEEDILTVHSDSLVQLVHERGPDANVIHTPSFEEALMALDKNVREKDVVIFLGAGSITDLAKTYSERLAARLQ